MSLRFFLSTEINFGMTSPARSTTTESPTRTSKRFISSSLCKVAFETTTPPTVTGSTLATGVIAPVLPTWKSIDSIVVIAFSDENLYAIAHRGELDVFPNLDWSSKLLTL